MVEEGDLPFGDMWERSQWAPVVDGEELTDTPLALLQAGATVADVPVIMGTNLDDGTEFISLTSSLAGSVPYNLTKVGVVRVRKVCVRKVCVRKVCAQGMSVRVRVRVRVCVGVYRACRVRGCACGVSVPCAVCLCRVCRVGCMGVRVGAQVMGCYEAAAPRP